LKTDSYLPRDRRPDLERVVIGAADDTAAAELEAGDDVVVVALQHLAGGRAGERRERRGQETVDNKWRLNRMTG